MAVVAIPSFDAVYGVDEAAICNRALSRISVDVIKDTDEDTKQSRICKAIYAQTRDELLRLYPFNFATKTRYIPLDTAYPLPTELYAYAYKAWDYRELNVEYTAASNILTVTTGTVYATDIGLAVFGADIPVNARIVDVDTVNNTITIDRPVIVTGTGIVKKYIPLLKIVHVGGNNNNLYELFGSNEGGRILTNISSGTQNNEQVLEMRCVEQVIDPKLFDSIFIDALVLRIAMKVAISFTQSAGLISLLYQEFAQILQAAKIASAEEKEIDQAEDWYASSGPTSKTRR